MTRDVPLESSSSASTNRSCTTAADVLCKWHTQVTWKSITKWWVGVIYSIHDLPYFILFLQTKCDPLVRRFDVCLTIWDKKLVLVNAEESAAHWYVISTTDRLLVVLDLSDPTAVSQHTFIADCWCLYNRRLVWIRPQYQCVLRHVASLFGVFQTRPTQMIHTEKYRQRHNSNYRK